MVITIIFIFIIFISKKQNLFFIQLIGCFSYFMQYSEYNYKLTEKVGRLKKSSLGNFFNSLPFASTGFTLAYLNIFNIIQNYKIKIFCFCFYVFALLEKYDIFCKISYRIGYSGILYNIRTICCIFIFAIIPISKIRNKNLEIILKYITNYTAGIYYLHLIIIFILKNFIIPIKNGTFIGLFMIYLICYLICFIGMKVFGKTKLKN